MKNVYFIDWNFGQILKVMEFYFENSFFEIKFLDFERWVDDFSLFCIELCIYCVINEVVQASLTIDKRIV